MLQLQQEDKGPFFPFLLRRCERGGRLSLSQTRGRLRRWRRRGAQRGRGGGGGGWWEGGRKEEEGRRWRGSRYSRRGPSHKGPSLPPASFSPALLCYVAGGGGGGGDTGGIGATPTLRRTYVVTRALALVPRCTMRVLVKYFFLSLHRCTRKRL